MKERKKLILNFCIVIMTFIFSLNCQQTNSKKYKMIFGKSEGLVLVQDFNNKYGFADEKGNLVISCKYVSALPFSEGLAAVTESNPMDGGWCYINKKDEKVISGYFNKVGSFYNGAAQVFVNHKFGYIDKHGQIVLPLIYEEVIEREFDGYSQKSAIKEVIGDGLLLVKNNNLYGFIDLEKKIEVIPCVYTYAYAFSEGLALVSKSNKNDITPIFGYIDKKGNVVLPFDYDIAMPFSEGCAVISKRSSDKRMFIDKSGNQVIPKEYEWCLSFKSGLALVKEGYREYYIDKNGSCVKGCIE